MAKETYEIRYKLKNNSTGSTGETHITTVQAESETNAVAEIQRQYQSYEVIVESLRVR